MGSYLHSSLLLFEHNHTFLEQCTFTTVVVSQTQFVSHASGWLRMMDEFRQCAFGAACDESYEWTNVAVIGLIEMRIVRQSF